MQSTVIDADFKVHHVQQSFHTLKMTSKFHVTK